MYLPLCASGPDTTFHFHGEGECTAFYHVHKGQDYLVMPSGKSFHETILWKLHHEALRGTKGQPKCLMHCKHMSSGYIYVLP